MSASNPIPDRQRVPPVVGIQNAQLVKVCINCHKHLVRNSQHGASFYICWNNDCKLCGQHTYWYEDVQEGSASVS